MSFSGDAGVSTVNGANIAKYYFVDLDGELRARGNAHYVTLNSLHFFLSRVSGSHLVSRAPQRNLQLKLHG